jgi:spore coat protein CotH
VPSPLKPETNEDDNDPSRFVAFVQAANSAPDAGFGAAMGAYIDVNRWLTHLAVENVLAGSDGFVGREGMNNFYLYEFANGGKFVLIPWDQDTTFVDYQWPVNFGLETNVLARRLTADAALQRAYLDAVKAAAARGLDPAVLVPKIDAIYALIREAVLADTKKPFTNEDFEAGVQAIRNSVVARREFLAAVP